MRSIRKCIGSVAIVAVLMFASYAIVSPASVEAKGRGGKPKPPPCDCPETIDTPYGECTLEDCGLDCVYACPLPFP